MFRYNNQRYPTLSDALQDLMKDIGDEDIVSVDTNSLIYRTSTTTYQIERI